MHAPGKTPASEGAQITKEELQSLKQRKIQMAFPAVPPTRGRSLAGRHRPTQRPIVQSAFPLLVERTGRRRHRKLQLCSGSCQAAPRLEALLSATELAKPGGIFARPLSPPQGGKYALVQLGLACCWLQGFPGSQPVSDEQRMGGGPVIQCTVKLPDSSPMGVKHPLSCPTACG